MMPPLQTLFTGIFRHIYAMSRHSDNERYSDELLAEITNGKWKKKVLNLSMTRWNLTGRFMLHHPQKNLSTHHVRVY
jgi:hypothetical protein